MRALHAPLPVSARGPPESTDCVPSLVLNDRQARGHEPPAAHVVDDIDTIVLPVRPCDPEKEGCPAPEAELSLPCQAAAEHDLARLRATKSSALLLTDAVYVHLERGTDPSRQGHARRVCRALRPWATPIACPLPAPSLLPPTFLVESASDAPDAASRPSRRAARPRHGRRRRWRGTAASRRSRPRSPNAAAIRDTYWLILGITGAIFVLVEAALVLFVVRYRRGRRSREAEGAQVHGHTRTEIAWTVDPGPDRVRDHRLRLRQAPGRPGRAEGERRELAERPDRRPPVLLAVHATRAARSRSTGWSFRSARSSR